MLIKVHKLLMDKADETNSASGYGTTNAETTTPTTTPEAKGNTGGDTTNNGTTKAEGTPNQAGAAGGESKQEATSTEQKKIPNVTGYNADGTKIEGSEGATGTEAKADDKTVVKEDKPLELDLKGMKEEDIKDLRDFSTAHKFTKEQAQALIDKRKENVLANEKYQNDLKAETQTIYKSWEKELREDPEFGKENFATNVHNVNKFMQDFMPGTTKLLTESGKRISPVQMKEFAKVAAKLYGEGEHTAGSGTAQTKERQPWDVYTN